MADDKIVTLKQQAARAITEMRRVHEAAEAEDRNLNAEEQQEFDRLTEAHSEFNARIKRAEDMRSAGADFDRYQNQLDGSALGHGRDEREATQTAREYRNAFEKYFRYGVTSMNADEQRALSMGEARTDMSTTNAVGGYSIPQSFSDTLFSLKIQAPGVIVAGAHMFKTSDGRPLPVPVATAHGATAWQTEGAAPTIVAETLGQVTLNADAAINLSRLSIQLLQDSAFNLEEYLQGIFLQKIARKANAAFIAGNSAGITGFKNTGSVAEVETALAAGPTDAEAQSWYYSLAPQYRINGTFLMHDSLVACLTKLKSSSGGYLYLPSLRDGEPNLFMGRPVVNDPDLDATGVDENVVGMFADWDNFYAVRQVQEANVTVLRERYADSLQVGVLAWQRFGGNVLDVAAGAQLAVGAG